MDFTKELQKNKDLGFDSKKYLKFKPNSIKKPSEESFHKKNTSFHPDQDEFDDNI